LADNAITGHVLPQKISKCTWFVTVRSEIDCLENLDKFTIFHLKYSCVFY
jgi:hypothetical protein